MEVTGAERDLLNGAVEEAMRFTADDVHKELLRADAGKDFRKLDSFKREWEGLPAGIRNDVSFVIRSRALALLAPPPKGETSMDFIGRLDRHFDLSDVLDEVRRYAQSIRPARPDPLAEAVALAAVEIWTARGRRFSVGNREAPSTFSRFLAGVLIEFLPHKYQIGPSERLRTEESRQHRAVYDAIEVLDRLAEEGRVRKPPRTAGRG